MSTKELIEIINLHQLSIEKRLEQFEYYKISLEETENHSYHVTEIFDRTGEKEPNHEKFFLLQYGDIIYQTESLSEMTTYISEHFTS